MIKVSVVVPVYNTASYLDRCLRSLVGQTLRELEIVAIDDGSDDGSAEILAAYAAQYPERFVCRRQENAGQGAARNLALQLCSGEYVGFLDSDDFARPEAFEKLYSAAAEQDADYVACGYTDLLIKNGKETVLRPYVASGVAGEPKELFFDALVSPFLHLYRRDLLQRSGAAFPEGLIYEDTAFYLELLPHIRRIAVIEEALVCRVRHGGSTMSTITAQRVAQIFPVLGAALAYYRENGFLAAYGQELTAFCVRILLCSSMNRISQVQSLRERHALVDRTLAFLKENFPAYRGNPYLQKGLKNRYLRSIGPLTGRMACALMRLRCRLGPPYVR